MQHQPENNTMIDLGTWVGRRQAFGLVSSKCSAADAECLKQIRENKSYKSVAAHWEEFCPRYLGLSRSHADKLIQQLDEFGAAYFELSQIVRIPAKAYRAISGAISGHSSNTKAKQSRSRMRTASESPRSSRYCGWNRKRSAPNC